MFKNGFIFRLIGVVVLLGVVSAGLFMAFKAGEANGISQAPAVATAIAKAAESGQGIPAPIYGYGYPYHHGFGPHFGFFPIGGLCFGIFFLFLFFGALKMIFFRRMMWHGRHHGHRGPWGKHWEDGVPPMFDEWHKRAHGETEIKES